MTNIDPDDYDDYKFDDDHESEICVECNGKGYIITCWDDLCANSDRCIHGDGEEICPSCGGRESI